MKKEKSLFVLILISTLVFSSCGSLSFLGLGGDSSTETATDSTKTADTTAILTVSLAQADTTLNEVVAPKEVQIGVKIKEPSEEDLKNRPELVEEAPAENLFTVVPEDSTADIVQTDVVEVPSKEEILAQQREDSIAIAEAKRLDEERKSNEAIEEAKKLEAEVIPPTEPKKITPALPGKTSIAVVKKYEASVNLAKSGNREAAIEQFNLLLSGEVNQDFADNCYYWIGESKFGLKDYKGAIESFKKVFEFKISEKKDDAQFMIARSYERLGNQKQATAEFNKLIEMYPLSELVPFAKKRVK